MFRPAVTCGVSLSMIIDTFQRGSRYALGALWSEFFPELMKLVEQERPCRTVAIRWRAGPSRAASWSPWRRTSPKMSRRHATKVTISWLIFRPCFPATSFLTCFPCKGKKWKACATTDVILFSMRKSPKRPVEFICGRGCLPWCCPARRTCPVSGPAANKVKKLVVKIPADKLSAPHCR